MVVTEISSNDGSPAVECLISNNKETTANGTESIQSTGNTQDTNSNLGLDEDDDGSLPCHCSEVNAAFGHLEDLSVLEIII